MGSFGDAPVTAADVAEKGLCIAFARVAIVRRKLSPEATATSRDVTTLTDARVTSGIRAIYARQCDPLARRATSVRPSPCFVVRWPRRASFLLLHTRPRKPRTAPTPAVAVGRIDGAALLRRIWKFDVALCPTCEGRSLRVISVIQNRAATVTFLERLGPPTEEPKPRRRVGRQLATSIPGASLGGRERGAKAPRSAQTSVCRSCGRALDLISMALGMLQALPELREDAEILRIGSYEARWVNAIRLPRGDVMRGATGS